MMQCSAMKTEEASTSEGLSSSLACSTEPSNHPQPQQRISPAKREELNDIDLLLLFAEFMRFMRSPSRLRQQSSPSAPRQKTTAPNDSDSFTPIPFPLNPQYQQFARERTNAKASEPERCDVTGECTADCEMFRSRLSRAVYICEHSGRLHYCTQHSCDSLEVSHSHRTCRITGSTYSLDTFCMAPDIDEFADRCHRQLIVDEPDIDDACGIPDLSDLPITDPNTDTKAASKKRKATDSDDEGERPLVKKTKHKKASLWTLSRGLPLLSQSSSADSKRSAESLFSDARTFLLTLAPHLENTQLLVDVANAAVGFWKQASLTHTFHHIKGRYRFHNHMAAFVFNCVDGIGSDGAFLVPPITGLKLPSPKRLPQIGVKAAAYTRTCRFLHLIAREIMFRKTSS